MHSPARWKKAGLRHSPLACPPRHPQLCKPLHTCQVDYENEFLLRRSGADWKEIHFLALAFFVVVLVLGLPAHGRIRGRGRKERRMKERTHHWQMSPKYASARLGLAWYLLGLRLKSTMGHGGGSLEWQRRLSIRGISKISSQMSLV